MTTQASVIINFHDDPEYCNNFLKRCNFLLGYHCVLRVVKPDKKGVEKYLELRERIDKDLFYKDPSCKFIWEKSKR